MRPVDPFTSTAGPRLRVPNTWRLLDDVELMELDDPEFTVDRILPRRGRIVVYGPSGVCKTTLVAGLFTAIATGRDWFGHAVINPGACCYVAAEDTAGFKVRLKAAKLAAGLSLEQRIGVYTFPDPIDLRDPISIRTFIHFMLQQTDFAVELVAIDTYAGATPGAAENSSEDTTLAMNAAAKIQDALRCGVLIVHHTNAGGTRERGHSSMRGAADTMISMTPVDDAIVVECSKQRNAAPFDTFTLKLTVVDAGGAVLQLAGDAPQPTASLTLTQAKALSILRDTFAANGATKTEWQCACVDVSERSFHRAAKMLVENGRVHQVGAHFCLSGKL
jgi:hypothetical protein